MFSRLSGYNIITPVITIPSIGGYGVTFTPAARMAPAIISENMLGSLAHSCVIFTAATLPLSNLKASNCDLSSTLGAIRVSSAIILDCCAELIPSSKTNRAIVHTASIITPQMTRHVAAWLMDIEYFGDSNIIPAPTEKLASTLTDSSQKWGQNGSCAHICQHRGNRELAVCCWAGDYKVSAKLVRNLARTLP